MLIITITKGHFLTDDIMSIFYAMDMYDIPETDMMLYVDGYCDSDYFVKENLTEKCQFMFTNLYGLIFDTEKEVLTEKDKICFHNLVVGYDNVFAQNSFELARAGFTRRLRDRVITKVGLSHLLQSKSSSHKIIVLTKSENSIQYTSSYLKQNLCSLVKAFSEEVFPIPEVICISNLSTMSFHDQFQLSLSATLVICEHGTTAYFNFFVRTGTVAIVLAPIEDPAGVKDPQILLHLTHVQIFYLRFFSEIGVDPVFEKDLHAMFQHTVYIASDNFNIDTTIVQTSQPSLSKRLKMIIDGKHDLAVSFDENGLRILDPRQGLSHNDTSKFDMFDLVWSHDRCTSTFKWCMSTYNDIPICEVMYLAMKKTMRYEDSKLYYDCD